MNIQATELTELYIIQSSPYADDRGAFSRLFCGDALSTMLEGRSIAQINHSSTNDIGAIRGLHAQKSPSAEMKIVRCLKGRVFDVAVDLRADSSTFLQWHGEELTPENNKALLIPEGFAHGFQVLDADSELLYLHTEFYHPEQEVGVRYDDPSIAIDWPLAVSTVSEKDKCSPYINESFRGLKV